LLALSLFINNYKTMKILLGNNTFSILAGSETYMLTLATELKKLGHEVTAYSPNLGFIATKLEQIGVKCINTLVGSQKAQVEPFNPILVEPEDDFDVAICAHYEITRTIRQKFPNLPIIAIVHGIIHSNPATGEIYPEHPVTDMFINQYVAVSEEIKEKLENEYGIESIVIRNLFDLEKFKKEGSLPKAPKRIMVNSNYWGVEDQINQIIKEVADHYKAEFVGVGANFASTYEVDKIVKTADVVFGMGRSVMEGVCAGKIGVVHGRWGTGGVVNPESYDTLKLTNFSGRPWTGDGRFLSPKEIISQIDASWNNKTINEMQKIIKKEHDSKVVTKKFLDIANKLINN